jgi:hypothetical protein
MKHSKRERERERKKERSTSLLYVNSRPKTSDPVETRIEF